MSRGVGPLITLCNVVKEHTKGWRRKSYHLHLRLSGDGVGLAHCWKVARLIALFNMKDTEEVQAAHVIRSRAPSTSSAQDRGATLLAGVSSGLSRGGPCKGWPLPSPSGGGLNAV